MHNNYQWIDDCIDGLAELYGTYNVYELYNALDIKIIKLPKENILLNGNQAFYFRCYLDEEVVFISDNINLQYEKFILAHELAHAVIHTDISSAAFNKMILNKDKLEKQANYFAFKLLRISFNEIELNNFTIEQISSYLEIPLNALKQIVDINI